MSLTIRPIRQSDIDGCLRVIASLPRFFAVEEQIAVPTAPYGRHGAPDHTDAAGPGGRSLAQAARDLDTQGGLVAAAPGGDVIAFLTWKRHDDVAAEVTWMAVHANLRHHGVGSTLLNRLERVLAAQGFRQISALTSALSHTYEPTRRFWRARGYVPALRLDDLWETDVALVLTKSLRP